MEQTEAYKAKLKTFEEVLVGFENLLDVNLENYDDIISDGLMNGQMQKFEYCTEMLWKLIRQNLWIFDGVDVNSPKPAIKEFYNAQKISGKEYEVLTEILEARNNMTHIYRKEVFTAIHARLPEFVKVMKETLLVLKQ